MCGQTWLAVPTYAAGRHGVLTAGVNVVCVGTAAVCVGTMGVWFIYSFNYAHQTQRQKMQACTR